MMYERQNNEIKSNNVLDDHYNPSVRLLQIPKTEQGSCGFHLSRSKWDPYPWVSVVDTNTPAEQSGLKVGDCVLEVNGKDILGLRIMEVANLVKLNQDNNISLLVWSTEKDPSCNSESICCGPMPLNLERLSASMQIILSALECPVCMNTIQPPVMQCQNGHLLCIKCKTLSEKCPVCRERYTNGRSLIAEQIYNSIMDTFKLRKQDNYDNKLQDKVFGDKYKKSTTATTATTAAGTAEAEAALSSSVSHNNLLAMNKIYKTQKNKFLTSILGKSSSLDNLSIIKNKENKNNNNNAKSLSTIDISKKRDLDSISSIPSRFPSINRLNGNLSNSKLEKLTFDVDERPSSLSLNTSTECIDRTSTPSSDISLLIPTLKVTTSDNEILYNCPLNCGKKLTGKTIQYHTRVHHNIPIVLFGSSNIEITLPVTTLYKDAFYLLFLNDKEFWMKLMTNNDGSIFISTLLQGYENENFDYMMEVRLKNRTHDSLLERELITRSMVYSLMNITWNEVQDKNLGIFYSYDTIITTFSNHNNLILKIDIKNRNER